MKEIQSRHFAFLISETEFDAVFKHICDKDTPYWADHKKEHANKINHNDGGRGFYFNDPDNHFLEVITRPYENVA